MVEESAEQQRDGWARLPKGFPDPASAPVAQHFLELVGSTPLLRVLQSEVPEDVEVYVKLDQFNFGASSKDRIGVNIVRRAIQSGDLKPGARIVDTGAGNTAIGFALAGIATGHPSTLVADETLSPEKRDFLTLLGVDIVPGRRDVPRDDPENWFSVAERIVREDPNSWYARQSEAASNPEAHVLSTGPEIWTQTEGRVTHFLAAIATGGTVSGTGQYLHQQNPDTRVVGTEFDEAAATTNVLPIFNREPGWESLERDFPLNVDLEVLDRIDHRSRRDAIRFGWRLIREFGVPVGISSALSLLIARDLAQDAPAGSVIVAFSADSARDYVQREYNGEWLRANDLGDIADEFGA